MTFIDRNMHHVNDYLMNAFDESDVMFMTLSEPLEDGQNGVRNMQQAVGSSPVSFAIPI